MTTKTTEWDVIQRNHRFVREDEEPKDVSWEERLARAYESKLFREFALIDLKHFKTKEIALRWRTATEVVEGVGDETCGSLRCKHHQPLDAESQQRDRSPHSERRSRRPPTLRTFELPFAYEEEGKRKETMVKVRLCSKCAAKLAWKPSEERDNGTLSRSQDRRSRREVDDRREGSKRRRYDER